MMNLRTTFKHRTHLAAEAAERAYEHYIYTLEKPKPPYSVVGFFDEKIFVLFRLGIKKYL